MLLDLVFFAPLGATIEFWEHLPDFARVGRDTFRRQRPAARMIGEFAVRQGRRRFEQSLVGSGEDRSGGRTAVPGTVPEPGQVAEPESGQVGEPEAEQVAEPVAVDLPIANYDALSAVQIVPLLGELSPEERELIRAHEESHRARRTVLGKLDQLARREAGSDG